MIMLETVRTTLRPLTTADCAAVQRWASVPENVTHMPWGPNTDADTLQFLETCEQSWAADPIQKYEFGIVLKETGELIGSCGVCIKDEFRAAELGWILRCDYWKHGIMTEAAGALIRFCFEERRLHRVFALCNATNYGSYKVMDRNGMRREGHYIKSRLPKDVKPETWCDAYSYALLEEEYFKA